MEEALLSPNPYAISRWLSSPEAAGADAALVALLTRLCTADDCGALSAAGVPCSQGDWPPTAASLDISAVPPALALPAAAACLAAFVTENVTGPVTTGASRSHADALAALARDGEPVCPQLRGAALLLAARALAQAAPETPARAWLLARVAVAHQRCIDVPCASLREEARAGYEAAVRAYGTDERLAGALHVERAAWHTFLSERRESSGALARASEALGLRLELAGAMGRRTKYQEKPTAQMYLEVAWQRAAPDPRDFPGRAVPAEVRLDETSDLLDHIAFLEPTDATILGPVGQAYALAVAADHKQRQPDHDIRTEEMLPYAERVLRDPTDWAVNAAALLLKSRLEHRAPKTSLRSLMQLEALVGEWARGGADDAPPAQFRRAAAFLVWYPVVWDLKRELGRRMYESGQSVAAFKLFEELGMFEEMVRCLLVTGQREKAEEVARARLHIEETPEMVCMLGDVTDDTHWYERAWEMTGGKFARAQRSIGHYHLRREQWRECAEHYSLALELNPMFPAIWFSCGCAYLRLSEWENARRAFARAVSLDGDDAESWGNLAAAQMRLGQAAAAHGSLREAARVRPDSWRIWQSFVGASIDARELRDAISGLTKLLELSVELPSDRAPPREPDPRPIFAIAHAVADNETCRGGYSARELAKPLARLLERYESEAQMSAALYDLFAYVSQVLGDTRGVYDRRCGQCRLLEGSWPGDAKRWALVSDAYLSLAQAAVALRDRAAIKTTADKIASVIARGAQHHSDSAEFGQLVSVLRKIENVK